MSHLMVSIELLGTGDFRIGEVAGLSGWQQFLLVHLVLASALVITLWRLLRKIRENTRGTLGQAVGG